MENPNPVVKIVADPQIPEQPFEYDPSTPIQPTDIFNLIRNINDPEHPLSLEELNVVQLEHISINLPDSQILVAFTPTIPHCSMATLIGLCIKIRLQAVFPPTFWIDVRIREGSHVSEDAINRQLADKERVCAALENPNLYKVVKACIEGPKIPGIVTSA